MISANPLAPACNAQTENTPISNLVENGIEPYYVSPTPTPQTENFFIDVIIADNINNRAQQIPQSSKLIYIYTLFQYGGQSFRKIWVLDNSNRAYGQGTPPIGSNNLIEFNTQALQQNSVVDLGDIGALVGNETYEEHLRDYINAQDPSIGLINSGTIRADFGGDVREFNFSNVTGDYGLNVNQTEVTDFQLYGESNNEEDAGTTVTKTSQIPINDGQDGTSRYIEEDELESLETDPTVPQYIKDLTSENIENFATAFEKNTINVTVTGDQNKQLTLTKRDGSILIATFTDNQGEVVDNVVNSIDFDETNGVLSIQTEEGNTLTTSFDGRYALWAHNHEISQINGLQGELDNTLKKTGETSQTIDGSIKLLGNNRTLGQESASYYYLLAGTQYSFIGFSSNGEYRISPTSNYGQAASSITNSTIFKGNGNVGLGKNPTEKLDIAGNVKAGKHITNGGDGTNLIDDNGDLVPKSTFATSGELNNAVKKTGETSQTIVGEVVADNFKTTDGNYKVETFSDNRTLGGGATTLQAGIEVQGSFESVLTRLLMGIEENGEAYLHADNHFTIRGKNLAQLLTDHYQLTNTENGYTFKEVGVSGHTVFKLDPTRFVNIAEVLLPKNSGRIVVSESTTIPSQSVPNLRYSSTTGTVSEIERPTSTFINTSNTGFSERNIT
ncbi:hypothetical protein, partial [Croceibacter atlanticus]|uniref:hypothetical protein n=1 Tax=Croceibacter atlanticus TaxID=313588 RepID=UPI0030DCECAF